MDDRSERLRERRKQSTGRSNGQSPADGSDETAERSEPSKPSQTEPDSLTDDDSAADEPVPVKEQQTGTYMYLPEAQVKRLRRQYNVLKAEYEFEYDEEFEKNRHFYPLVVKYGLEQLDEMDTEEIRARLDAFYE